MKHLLMGLVLATPLLAGAQSSVIIKQVYVQDGKEYVKIENPSEEARNLLAEARRELEAAKKAAKEEMEKTNASVFKEIQ